MDTPTDKTLFGFVWAFAERFGEQAMKLVIFILLARMLSPHAFGLIGMLAVFIAISRSLADSGFGQALIQKKDTNEADYSSVFYINMAVSVLMYGILFFTAHLIADFYGQPVLTDLVRVLGLRFIIEAFSMVQIARLTKKIKFKKLMIAKLPSTLLGGAAGIGAAYSGMGVWSLVIQQLTDNTAYSIQVWIQSNWTPRWVFEWERVKELFDFGSKMMISSLIHTTFKKIYEIVIGRYYSAAQVGFYMQADKIKHLPVYNISSTISRVAFPVLSEVQDDDESLKKAYKKMIRQVVFFMAPIMIGAAVIATPLFRFVLTDKWLPAVPYFQWLCISGFFIPINSFNLNILKVKGRSDLLLNLEIIKKGISIVGIAIAIQYSVLALVIVQAITAAISYAINSYYSRVFIDYGMLQQIKDFFLMVIAAAFMGLSLMFFNYYIELSDLLLLITNVIGGGLLYVSLIAAVDRPILQSSKAIIKKLFKTN